MLIFVIVIIIFSGNSSLVTYVYNIRIATIEFLTHYASISQEKFPIRLLNFSKFCTFLVSLMVKEVLPLMVDL